MGQWPKASSGEVEETPGETWRNIAQALEKGLRGLPGNYSLAQLLANNPTVTTDAPERFLYTLNEAADLGEPNAMMTLIALKLSSSVQFANVVSSLRLKKAA